MRRRTPFWRCLWPRLALAAYFSAVGFFGGGGDPEAYHLMGMHVKTMWEEGHADLETTLTDVGWDDPVPFLDNYWTLYYHSTQPKFEPIFFNSISIIYVHAALYRIWANPFIYVALTALLSAWATSRFITSFALERYERWFIWNPVSIFYAATHFKESLIESLVLLVAIYWFRERRYIRTGLAMVLIAAFRFSYAPLVGVVLAGRLIRRIPGRTLLAAAVVMLAILPAFHWTYPHGELGPVYSVLYANAWTKKTITPLFGMLQPMPLVVLRDFYTTTFYTLYSLFYLPLLAGVITWTILNRRNNAMITASLLVEPADRYYAQAEPSTKGR